MSKNKISILMLLLGAMASSCNLDYEPTTQYSASTFWFSSKNTEGGLVGCYTPLISGYLYGQSAIAFEECVTPNAYNYYNSNGWNDIAKGTHTKDSDIANGRWTQCYIGIGRCNNLLDNVDRSKDMTAAEIARTKGEAKFLRAWYYSILSTYYYSAPLITATPDIAQIDEPRADRAELVDFIVNELTEAATLLPKTVGGSELGRATKGAALALKARVLLFEASPLCNPSGAVEPYRKAAAAAKEVMDLGVYSLFPDYASLFKEANENSAECIFDLQCISHPVKCGHSLDMVHAQYDSAAPLQELADGMYMRDGKPRSASRYSNAAGFDKMDPRFAACVAYPGSTWMGREVKMESNACFTNIQTGYLFKKYTIYSEAAPTTAQLDMRSKAQCSPTNLMLIRYADVLLMYAEAMNEAGEMSLEVWNATVRAVRARAKLDDEALVYPSDKKAVREAIRYERRAEFLGEGTWYNDLRRNKLAETVCQGPVHRYDGVELNVRNFNAARDYWWPVPAKQVELAPNLEPNNPNW